MLPHRLKVTWNDGNKLSAKEGAAKKMRLLITSQYQGTEQIIRKLSLASETSEEEKKEIFFSAKNQFSSLEDLCEKVRKYFVELILIFPSLTVCDVRLGYPGPSTTWRPCSVRMFMSAVWWAVSR